MPELERLSTGVIGLDELLGGELMGGGGIPRGFSVLISGYTGTGKTILTLQMVCNMVTKGEKALYLTFEEDIEDLIGQGEDFGWNIRELVDGGKLQIVSIQTQGYEIDKIIGLIKEKANKDKITMLVVDSLTMMSGLVRSVETGENNHAYYHENTFYILKEIKKLGLTCIYIADVHHPGMHGLHGVMLTDEGIVEYECDCVILLRKTVSEKEGRRLLSIEKMRRTAIDDRIHGYVISKDRGIIVA